MTWRAGWQVDCAVGLLAAQSSGGSGGQFAGKYYFEATTVSSSNEGDACVGLALSSFTLANPVQLDLAAGPYAGANGGAFISVKPAGAQDGWSGNPGPAPDGVGGGWVSGNVLGFAYDSTNKLLWWRNVSVAPNTWYGKGVSANPNTGTNGYPLSDATASGTCYVLVGGGGGYGSGSGPNVTVNFGASGFVGSLPTGFAAWDASGLSALNPSDKAAAIVLSNSNLRATVGPITGANQPTAFVRSNTFH